MGLKASKAQCSEEVPPGGGVSTEMLAGALNGQLPGGGAESLGGLGGANPLSGLGAPPSPAGEGSFGGEQGLEALGLGPPGEPIGALASSLPNPASGKTPSTTCRAS